MKSIILTIATLVISSTSLAIVGDKFKCLLEVKELGSKISSNVVKEFFIVRLPLSTSLAPDIRITGSKAAESLTLITQKGKFEAIQFISYKQAVRLDAQGNPLEARQESCIFSVGSYCKKFIDGGFSKCKNTSIACREISDPFNPNYGWSPTGLLNGIPIFNEQDLVPESSSIYDDKGNTVGTLNSTCHYLGSFQ